MRERLHFVANLGHEAPALRIFSSCSTTSEPSSSPAAAARLNLLQQAPAKSHSTLTIMKVTNKEGGETFVEQYKALLEQTQGTHCDTR